MSNVKEVEIIAEVPWDWASRLPGIEAAQFAGLFLNPVIGVHLNQSSIGYVPNSHGGQTHMYRITISGHEALNFRFLDRLTTALASVGTVTDAWARDDENDGDWEPLSDTYSPTGGI